MGVSACMRIHGYVHAMSLYVCIGVYMGIPIDMGIYYMGVDECMCIDGYVWIVVGMYEYMCKDMYGKVWVCIVTVSMYSVGKYECVDMCMDVGCVYSCGYV